jgi:5-methylcytosine-specific restriction endonuclease McrA
MGRTRGVTVTLSKEEHIFLLSQPCYYCNGPLNRRGYGLDQVSPGKGYVRGNVVPCCKKCNQAKNNMTTEEFAKWITVVYEAFAKKAMASIKVNQQEPFDLAALQQLRKQSP